MVIALISGISRLDLGTETTETSVCPLSRLDRQEVDGVHRLSLVVGSFRPQRFDVLRRQKELTDQFLQQFVTCQPTSGFVKKLLPR